MKKLLIILSLALIGCDVRTETEKNIERIENRYDLIIIDECEYLMFYDVGRAGFMAHKGNCKNH